MAVINFLFIFSFFFFSVYQNFDFFRKLCRAVEFMGEESKVNSIVFCQKFSSLFNYFFPELHKNLISKWSQGISKGLVIEI